MIVSPPRATYRQSYAARIALTILFLCLAALPPIFAQGEFTPLVIAAMVAIVALDVAICWMIGKSILTIHDEGIRRTSIFGLKEIEWRNVKEYRYRAVPTQGAAHGLLGVIVIGIANKVGGRKATTNLILDLISNDGTKIRVTSSTKNAYEAIGVIIAAAHEQLKPRITAALGSTGAEFGLLRLSARDLQWKTKDPVPLREIAFAELAGQMLSIKKEGKLFSLVSVRSDKVPNVLLLLESLESLGVGASRMKSVDPLAHVRS
jgi:hypothetical protein